MSTFTPKNKSSQISPTIEQKHNASWMNQQHSDIAGAGMDVQTMDSTVTSMDDAGNILETVWTITTKETG